MGMLPEALPRTTQTKVMRTRVLQHDLDMYAAIAGRPPAVPLPEEPTERTITVPTAARARLWSPAVLAAYLGNVHLPRLGGADVAHWVRCVSSRTLRKFQEAHARLKT